MGSTAAASAAPSGVSDNPQDHYITSHSLCAAVPSSISNAKASAESAPSPSSPTNQCMRSMEEVWQEIDLSSLLDHPCPSPGPAIATATCHTGGEAAVSLQDFLAQPFHEDSNNPPSHQTSTGDSPVSEFPRPTPAPVLSFTSRDDFTTCPEGTAYDKIRADPPRLHACSSVYNSFLCKNRAQAQMENADGHSDRNRKRLLKNRETAARSRARKQAYTNELENEVDHLRQENERLRRQYHEVQLCFLKSTACAEH